MGNYGKIMQKIFGTFVKLGLFFDQGGFRLEEGLFGLN